MVRRLSSFLLALCLVGIQSVDASAAQPSNDNIASATALPPSPFVDVVNTAEATVESNEPAPCGSPVTNTVWYRFDSAGAFYNVIVDTVASDYPASMTFFTGSPDSLQLQFCIGPNSFLFFGTSPNQIWYIQVSGTPGAGESGNLVFNWVPEVTVPIDVQLSVDSSATVNRAGDLATISGTVTCSRPGLMQVGATLTQRFAGRLVATGSGASEQFECNTIATPWSVAIPPNSSVMFGPGKGTAEVSAGTCDALGCGTGQTTQTVHVRRVN